MTLIIKSIHIINLHFGTYLIKYGCKNLTAKDTSIEFPALL